MRSKFAFSSEEKRKEGLRKLLHWEEYSKQIPEQKQYLQTIDWKELQLEYRNHIDLVKMLQLIPGLEQLLELLLIINFSMYLVKRR